MGGTVTSFDSADGDGAFHPWFDVTGSVAFLRFFIPEPAVPKARPRVVRQGEHARAYTPQKTKDWEEQVHWEARAILSQIESSKTWFPFQERTIVELTFYFDKPKSYPKKLKSHLRKPDVDNLGKSMLDGLEGVLLENDNIVTDLILRKRYTLNGEPEGVLVEVTGWVE